LQSHVYHDIVVNDKAFAHTFAATKTNSIDDEKFERVTEFISVFFFIFIDYTF
jgi:hypothetical protein